jgi:hypothetical protein
MHMRMACVTASACVMLKLSKEGMLQSGKADSVRRWPATPLLDAVLGKEGIDFDQPETWPEAWEVQELDDIRFFNLMGPQWAALDYHLNPWGKGLSDGRWEWTMDTYASVPEC